MSGEVVEMDDFQFALQSDLTAGPSHGSANEKSERHDQSHDCQGACSSREASQSPSSWEPGLFVDPRHVPKRMPYGHASFQRQPACVLF
jgi:hypothetical protein